MFIVPPTQSQLPRWPFQRFHDHEITIGLEQTQAATLFVARIPHSILLKD